MGRCFMCEPPAVVPDDELGEHLQTVHGVDPDEQFLRWPDGETVIVDSTLQPADFEPRQP